MPDPLYKLLKAATAEHLVSLVNQAMQDDWQPAGGPRWYERELTWIQAMHKPVPPQRPAPDLRSLTPLQDVKLREPASESKRLIDRVREG